MSSERANVKRVVVGVGDARANNLSVLLFYMTSVIVVCLAAFNFYLFCWIVASLSGGSGFASENQQEQQRRVAIDLVSSWNSVSFEGRVASRRDLEVDQVLARGKRLALISKSSVQVAGRDQDSSTSRNRTLLELRAADQHIRFPEGLLVRALNSQEPALVCRPEVACELQRARRITLSAPEGVDFGRRSVQSPLLETGRLHSPTKALRLFGTDGSSFEARAGRLDLFALDGVSLFSRDSAVILDAKRIDISRVGSAKRRRSEDKAFKLCVCLAPANSQARERRQPEALSNEGLVFAVRPRLSCSDFTSFCRSG